MSKTVWIINQYASTPSHGIGGRHYYLGRELVKKGYKVYVIASSSHHLLRNKPECDKHFLIENVDGLNFVWLKMPDYENSHSKQRAINWFLFAYRLRKLNKIINDKPDAILFSSPSPLGFLGAQRLSKRMKARLIFEVRDIWPLSLTEIGGLSSKNPFIRVMQWVEDKAYRDSDMVISNLKNSIEHMINRGMNPGKFFWIPNGFSLDEVNKKVLISGKVAKQLPKNKFIVGYTGTLGVANALDVLIYAAEKLRKYKDICFVLVGGGREKVALQALADQKRLENVIFLEPIPKEQIQSILEHFDTCYIGWHKDDLYRFGIAANKIFDYLYSGKPIIHAYSGGFDPITEAQAGLQVPAEDSQQLAEAVIQIYDMDITERQKMGANGRKAALEHYQYEHLAEKLAEVLFK